MMFLGLLLAAAPQGQVHVVDAAGAPGSDFTVLSAAVRQEQDLEAINHVTNISIFIMHNMHTI